MLSQGDNDGSRPTFSTSIELDIDLLVHVLGQVEDVFLFGLLLLLLLLLLVLGTATRSTATLLLLCATAACSVRRITASAAAASRHPERASVGHGSLGWVGGKLNRESRGEYTLGFGGGEIKRAVFSRSQRDPGSTDDGTSEEDAVRSEPVSTPEREGGERVARRVRDFWRGQVQREEKARVWRGRRVEQARSDRKKRGRQHEWGRQQEGPSRGGAGCWRCMPGGAANGQPGRGPVSGFRFRT